MINRKKPNVSQFGLLGKRAQNLASAIGLVAIVLIILFSVIAFNVSKFGEKKPISVSLSINSYSLELQRVAVYAISGDFNGSGKGKMLNDIYLNSDWKGIATENYMVTGMSNINPVRIEIRGLPKLNIEGYVPIINIKNEMNLANYFYISCERCSNKYIPFGIERSKK